MEFHPETRSPITRWALMHPPHRQADPTAHGFRDERQRDRWVAENPGMRKAVGKRHPAVKALRQRWAAERKAKVTR